MKIKRLVVMMVVLLMVMAGVVGCTSSPETDQDSESKPSQEVETEENQGSEQVEESASAEKLTIALSLKTITNDPFQKSLADAVEQSVEEAGHNFELVLAGDETAIATQVKQLEDLVSKKVDGIILNPMDSNACIPVLKSAKEAGIPVVLVDSTIADGNDDLYITYIGTDNYNAGKVGGEVLAEALGGKGNVLVVRGADGSYAGDQRVDGFKAGAEAGGLVVVGEQCSDWKNDKAMQVMENMLQGNSDVQGAFSASDTILDGILQAMKNNDRMSIKVMSVDGTVKAIELIETGEIMGTMAQFPTEMGSKAVETILGIIDGSLDVSTVEKFTDSGTMAYTIDNLDEAKELAF